MPTDLTPYNEKDEPHGYWETYHSNGKLWFNSQNLTVAPTTNVPNAEKQKHTLKTQQMETTQFQDWKAELIQITAKETNTPEEEIKINDEAAKEWYESGFSPYYCFRENWMNDGN